MEGQSLEKPSSDLSRCELQRPHQLAPAWRLRLELQKDALNPISSRTVPFSHLIHLFSYLRKKLEMGQKRVIFISSILMGSYFYLIESVFIPYLRYHILYLRYQEKAYYTLLHKLKLYDKLQHKWTFQSSALFNDEWHKDSNNISHSYMYTTSKQYNN